MTAPFVATVTKPAAGPAGRSRLWRALVAAALLLPLLLAVGLLAWIALTRVAGDNRAIWMSRLFGYEAHRPGEFACLLPQEVGPCRGAVSRFFYNADTGRCEPFLYGGCDGNANNFETVDRCNERCVDQSAGGEQRMDPSQAGSTAICTLPALTGRCRAMLTRYFFDAETSSCREFIYGGCDGNENNFETIEDCEKRCASSEDEAEFDCASEPDGGNCMAYLERYAYRPQTKTCEMFVYGGCDGNGNRYITKEECEENCAGKADPDADL